MYTSCTPPDLLLAANNARESVIPAKSKERYEAMYQSFLKWQSENKTSSFSENVILAFFRNLSISKAPPTLWSSYSMLRAMLKFNHEIDISKFSNLIRFIKAKNKGYVPRKAAVFSDTEIAKFLNKAPNEIHLATKVSNTYLPIYLVLCTHRLTFARYGPGSWWTLP